MALNPQLLKTALGMAFMEHPAIPLTPGQNITKETKNYLQMSMNAGGQAFITVMPEPFGVNIGQIFQGQLPVGMTIGQAIGAQLTSMAMTYQSTFQIGPPVTPPTHIPALMKLFTEQPKSGMEFGQNLGGVIADWIGVWVVSGMLPGTPPVPFAGPLS
jgi:hypothetical protein